MITILSFMTAVFWGQLSQCEALVGITQYTCTNKVAYGAVSAFAVILFLLQGGFTAIVVLWRGELINETGLYDDVSSTSIQSSVNSNSNTFPYEFQSSGSSRNVSADI